MRANGNALTKVVSSVCSASTVDSHHFERPVGHDQQILRVPRDARRA
jgi:hypothetical protein